MTRGHFSYNKGLKPGGQEKKVTEHRRLEGWSRVTPSNQRNLGHYHIRIQGSQIL